MTRKSWTRRSNLGSQMETPQKKKTRVLTRKKSVPIFEPLAGGGRHYLTWNFGVVCGGESFDCGFCGSRVAPSRGEFAGLAKILVCNNCSRPTFIDEDHRQYPEKPFGNPVEVSDESVRSIYEEARQAISAGAHTASVLCSRKLLMHIAVERGAPADKNFTFYVEFLSANNHVPPACKTWIDQIRLLGNEANHQIQISEREDAEQLLQFNEMLLKIFYEYPARAAARNGKSK